MTMEKAFGEELRKARENCGLSQDKLGFESGYRRTYIRVRTPGELKKSIWDKSTIRFFIQLDCGAQSAKRIQYNSRRRVFLLCNEIDGTRQTLTSRQLMSSQHGNIGRAMALGAFFAELPGE